MRLGNLMAMLVLAATPTLAAPPPPPNAFNDQMLTLTPANQRGALRRAVTLENMRCGRLSQALYRGRFGNLGYWQGRCDPGGDYAVFLGPDGTAQVRQCSEMAGLKLPACVAMKK